MSRINRLPSIIPADLDMRVQVRIQAMQLAVSLADHLSANPDDVDKIAKKFETYIWGGFMPVQLPPTPLGTLEEAASALKARIHELRVNSADPVVREDLAQAMACVERAISFCHIAVKE
jgi:hypothetical protein